MRCAGQIFQALPHPHCGGPSPAVIIPLHLVRTAIEGRVVHNLEGYIAIITMLVDDLEGGVPLLDIEPAFPFDPPPL